MKKRITLAVKDLKQGLLMFKVAVHIAVTETIARYRRSVLGSFWIVLGTLIGVFGLSFIWSTLLRVPQEEFIPLVSTGLILWQLIAAVLTEAPSCFIRYSSTLKDIRLPCFFVTQTLVYKHFISFLHALFVLVVVFIYCKKSVDWNILWALMCLFFLMLNLLAWGHILAFISARFRDMESLVSAIIPLLFFFTPVLYRTKQLEHMKWLMQYNPISHFIDGIREPLLGHPIEITSTITVLVMITIVSWLVALFVTAWGRHQLAYWL